ncbi:MAG: single-stranded DNA-binding protein [Oscillospiraceae bacterium]
MNRTVMMGRIVNDLELSVTPNGTTYLKFRIAVDRNFQKKGEDHKADFFNVTAWRGTAEFINNYFGKGRMILIEGEFQTSQYTDKNGNQATWYELVAENAYFTGEKANGDAPAQSSTAGQSTNNSPAKAETGFSEPSPSQADDDYPF